MIHLQQKAPTMPRHNPDHVAALAAQMLPAHGGTEIHHIRRSIATANLLLDEVHAAGEAEDKAAAEAAEAAKAAKPDKPDKGAKAEAEKPAK